MNQATKNESIFTIEGLNDKPKPCPRDRCKGSVQPTANANVGKCDVCETRYNWANLNK